MENLDNTVSSGDAVSPFIDGTIADAIYQAVYDANIDSYAANAEVTDGQNISSSAITYFTGVLENYILPKDYVVYVGAPYEYYSGAYTRTAYEYCMAVGDFDLNGTYFDGNNVTVHTLRLSGDVSVDVESFSEFDVDAPVYYSRSNLGDYSGIVQYDYLNIGVLTALIFGGVVWFVKKLLQVDF